MNEFRVEQDIFKTGHLIFEGSAAEVYIYLKRWNFAEASMVWVVDTVSGDRVGSTAWFNTMRRELVFVVVDEAMAIGVHDTGSPEYIKLAGEYTDKIMDIV